MPIDIVSVKVYNRTFREATLVNAVAATQDGEWVDIYGVHPLSLDISGITTATLQVRISNDLVKPADTSHERQAGTDITADSTVTIDAPYRWLKIRISAWASGTITVRMVGLGG